MKKFICLLGCLQSTVLFAATSQEFVFENNTVKAVSQEVSSYKDTINSILKDIHDNGSYFDVKFEDTKTMSSGIYKFNFHVDGYLKRDVITRNRKKGLLIQKKSIYDQVITYKNQEVFSEANGLKIVYIINGKDGSKIREQRITPDYPIELKQFFPSAPKLGLVSDYDYAQLNGTTDKKFIIQTYSEYLSAKEIQNIGSITIKIK